MFLILSFSFQENVVIALQRVTAARFRSCIAGADTTSAPGLNAEGPGAQ